MFLESFSNTARSLCFLTAMALHTLPIPARAEEGPKPSFSEISLKAGWEELVQQMAASSQYRRPEAFVINKDGFKIARDGKSYVPSNSAFHIPLERCPDPTAFTDIWTSIGEKSNNNPTDNAACQIDMALETVAVASWTGDETGRFADLKAFFDPEAYPGLRAIPNDPVRVMSMALMSEDVPYEDAVALLKDPSGRQRALGILDRLWGSVSIVDDDSVALASVAEGRARFALASDTPIGKGGSDWSGLAMLPAYMQMNPKFRSPTEKWAEVNIGAPPDPLKSEMVSMFRGSDGKAVQWYSPPGGLVVGDLKVAALPIGDSAGALKRSYEATTAQSPWRSNASYFPVVAKKSELVPTVGLTSTDNTFVQGDFNGWLAKGPDKTHAAAIDLFYGTTRLNESPNGKPPSFGSTHDVGRLNTGTLTVLVPDTYRLVDETETSWFKKIWSKEPEFEITARVAGSLADHLKRVDPRGSGTKAFLYVHGFRTDFDYAARSTAKLAYDLQETGFAPMMFSWASGGDDANYFADEDRANASGRAFVQFVQMILDDDAISELHIMAHSMGSRVVMQGLERLRENRYGNVGKLKSVIFAAADVSTATFREFYKGMFEGDRKFSASFYVSGDDHALFASSEVHAVGRIGLLNDATLMLRGIEIVDVGELKIDFWGHRTHMLSRRFLSDAQTFMLDRTPASQRLAMRRHPIEKYRDFVMQLVADDK